METELFDKIKKSIQNIEQKKNKLYFFVQDTKGNPKASIAYIYEMAKKLHTDGFSVVILHEKNEFVPVSSWLGDEFSELRLKILTSKSLLKTS